MQKSKATRIIGIDFGMARIGIAYSDETKIIATPFITMKTDRKSGRTIELLVDVLKKHALEYNYKIGEIVVGLPLMMSGKYGMLADEVKHFVELLKGVIDAPVVTWDERLTSVQADRSLREGSFTRKKRAQYVDTVAAVIILQNYLDSKKQDP